MMTEFKVRYSYLPEQFADPEPVLAELRRLVPTGDFTLGKPVAEFERRFAELIGVRHAIGVGSGHRRIEIAVEGVGHRARGRGHHRRQHLHRHRRSPSPRPVRGRCSSTATTVSASTSNGSRPR